MKKNVLTCATYCSLFWACTTALAACNKNNSYIDAAYPDQVVYMSQSATATVGPGANGTYNITPNIPGQAQRFSVDVAGGKFNIPLGIIKSGVSISGAYAISIGSNADSVNKLIALGKFAVSSDRR